VGARRLVAVATPNVGVTNVGDVARTMPPEPVTVCPKDVWTPAPKLVIPVPPDAIGNVPVVKTDVDVAYTAPPDVKDVKLVPPDAVGNVPVAKTDDDVAYTAPPDVKDVRFVPPFAVASVPATVIAPDVAVDGVKPIEPNVMDVTAELVSVAHDGAAPVFPTST
jgi:hypothetical protein